MENVHDIDKKPWISSRTIFVKQCVEERKAQLLENDIKLSDDPSKSTCDCDNDNAYSENLSQELDNFIKSSEKDVRPFFMFNSTDEKALTDNPKCDLKTYKLQFDHAKTMISDRSYKVNYLNRLTTKRRELLMRHLALLNRQPVDSVPNIQFSTSEPIIAVLVIQIWPQPYKSNKARLEKEVLFRADQPLTDLRDQIKCQRDYGVPMDLSENPDQERIFRGELFKSGFFLIGDTFYNDMRDPNNTDLSGPIIEWSKKEFLTIDEEGSNVRIGRGIGPFKQRTMEGHKFEDLKLRLGCPYLYLHQGNCEHLFCISDLKYVTNDVNLQRMQFPFVTATAIGRKSDNLRCYMCKSRPPHWYTRGNDRLPVDPYFFCENCFYSFNYDSSKQKVGQFQAYLFTSAFGIPDSVIMSNNPGTET